MYLSCKSLLWRLTLFVCYKRCTIRKYFHYQRRKSCNDCRHRTTFCIQRHLNQLFLFLSTILHNTTFHIRHLQLLLHIHRLVNKYKCTIKVHRLLYFDINHCIKNQNTWYLFTRDSSCVRNSGRCSCGRGYGCL